MPTRLRGRSKTTSNLEKAYDTALELLHGSDIKAFMKYIEKRSELVRLTGKGNSTLLHVACALSKIGFVEFLLSKGANIDAVDDYGRTVLMDAVYYANVPLVRVLLLHGSDISKASNKRSTALYYATRGQEGNMEILNMLLSSIRQKEKDSILNFLIQDVSPCKTALDFAQNPKIREVLEQHGAVSGAQVEIRQRYEYQLPKVGETLRFRGYVPKYPALLLPGTCSCALELWQSTKSAWKGARIWLDPFKLGLKIAHRLNDSQFYEHMRLEDDGISDPPGICARAVEGIHGIDYLISSGPQALVSPSVVWGEVIRMLSDIGYNANNLLAFSYDWRLAPSALQQRDKILNKLQRNIEYLHDVNNQRVALVGHSQGCKFAQYFLHWAEDHLGKEWIDAHIETVIAIAPPWIGAPKVVRALITGDSLGLPTQVLLGDKWMVAMTRTFSSCPWLLPYGNLDHCIHFKNDGPKHWRDILSKESETFNSFMEKYYDSCPYLTQTTPDGQPKTLHFPYVRSIHCIYGVNAKEIPNSGEIGTEIGCYYSERTSVRHVANKNLTYRLDHFDENIPDTRTCVRNGIVKERPMGNFPSGDGTVPYESLSWADKWRGIPGAPVIKTYEFEGVCHREALLEPPVLSLLGELLCGGNPNEIRSADTKVPSIFDKSLDEIMESLADHTTGIPYLVSCIITSLMQTNSLSVRNIGTEPPLQEDVKVYGIKFADYRQAEMKELDDVYVHSRVGILHTFFHSLDRPIFGNTMPEALASLDTSKIDTQFFNSVVKILSSTRQEPLVKLLLLFCYNIITNPVNGVTWDSLGPAIALSVFGSSLCVDNIALLKVLGIIIQNFHSLDLG